MSETVKEYNHRYYREHKIRWSYFAKAQKDKKPWIRLRQRYNVTKDRYEELFRLQKGLCAICKEQSEMRLAVDHDHNTKCVRGLLCRSCNSGLGFFKENVHNIESAFHYLSKGAI